MDFISGSEKIKPDKSREEKNKKRLHIEKSLIKIDKLDINTKKR